MNNTQAKNLSTTGWHCCHCKSFNKLATARFCGHCGHARQEVIPQVTTPIIQPDTNQNLISKQENSNASEKENWLNTIKSFILPSNEQIFKTVICTAIFLLISSVVLAYKMYTNVNTIRLANTRFSDVAIDHPIYEVCKGLLSIDAIGFRKNLELAPHENISVAEWNHVLNQASKRLNKEYPMTAYFSNNEVITPEAINSKLKSLKNVDSEITDISRIHSFYKLEQALFK